MGLPSQNGCSCSDGPALNMCYSFPDDKNGALTLTSQLWSYGGICWVSTLSSVPAPASASIRAPKSCCHFISANCGGFDRQPITPQFRPIKHLLKSDQEPLLHGSNSSSPQSVLQRFTNDQHVLKTFWRSIEQGRRSTGVCWWNPHTFKSMCGAWRDRGNKHETALHPRRVSVCVSICLYACVYSAGARLNHELTPLSGEKGSNQAWRDSHRSIFTSFFHQATFCLALRLPLVR